MKTVFLVCILLLGTVSGSFLRSQVTTLRDLLPQSRIVGGSLATAGQFPYQVALSMSDGASSWFCGGSIIDAYWILTAAHCTQGWATITNLSHVYQIFILCRAIKVDIKAGTLNVNKLDSTAQTRTVTKAADIKIHTEYNPSTLNHDISVIRLTTPLDLNYYVWPIQVASRSDVGNKFEGETGLASGWGKILDSTNKISNELRFVHMIVENHDTCKSYYIAGLVTDGTICTNTAGGLTSTCNGDSGGPLVINNRLVGVTSFVSAAGCESGGPSGFTIVTSYLDWIKRNTGLSVWN